MPEIPIGTILMSEPPTTGQRIMLENGQQAEVGKVNHETRLVELLIWGGAMKLHGQYEIQEP